MPNQFQFETVQHFNAPNRRYRFNVDESRGSLNAKVDAEYFYEKTNEWRKVRSWNTKERLYNFSLEQQEDGLDDGRFDAFRND